MAIRVLIAGISGAMGYYLAQEWMKQPDTKLYGLGRREIIELDANYYQCDLSDNVSAIMVAELMDTIRPDYVFYLAGAADVRRSFSDVQRFIDDNISAFATFLTGMAGSRERPRLVLCSTSEVYGNTRSSSIREDHGFAPTSPYAVTKVAQEHLATTYGAVHKIPIIITRAFGYINPRREDLFATAIARRIVACERGESDEVIHGTLNIKRTFCDARDVAQAYIQAALSCKPGQAYNIGSENPVSLDDMLFGLVTRSSKRDLVLRQDESLVRPTDVFYCAPDCSKFRMATGWVPKRSLDESLDWLMDEVRRYWTTH